MSNLNNNDMPTVNINTVIDKLSLVYSKAILNKIPLKKIPSVMLWGPPGVGKSQAIRQIGKEIELSTGKKVNIVDVRLLLFNPIDLRGIPTANADKTLAVWLKPHIFNMDESDKIVNILFLDEISAAPQTVQSAAYQITLDRVIGEHKLPDNCIVIAAGNRVTDKSVAYKMPKALANRLLHFDIEEDFDEWKKWAIRNGINAKVVGFLTFKPTSLMYFDTGSDSLAFPTPRSWEMVSNLLNTISDDVIEMYDLISGIIGIGAATEFRSWSKLYDNLPKVEDIFKGLNPPCPIKTDELYALISSMVVYAMKHKDDMKQIAASIRYINQFPADFAAVVIKDYLAIEKDYKRKLMKLPEFMDFVRTKGKYLNGII
jgi:hypothetical protein